MINQHFRQFLSLHQTQQPLFISNVWDAASAAIAAMNGAVAIATSSAAVAWSLGYADGSQLPKEELIAAVKRILRVTSIPMSVDVENGYSHNTKQVSLLIKELVELGVAGINIEDGADNPALLIDKISSIRDTVGENLFINARTDVYLRQLTAPQQAASKAIERLQHYQSVGANGGFIPGLLEIADWSELTKVFSMPLNAMIPSPDYKVTQLHALGIRRFSTGPSSFLKSYSAFNVAPEPLSYEQINRLF